MRQFCAICDQPIDDEKCYVLDPDFPDGACVCSSCMDDQLKAIKGVTNSFLYEFIHDEIKYEIGMVKTPAKERSWARELWEEPVWN